MKTPEPPSSSSYGSSRNMPIEVNFTSPLVEQTPSCGDELEVQHIEKELQIIEAELQESQEIIEVVLKDQVEERKEEQPPKNNRILTKIRNFH